MLEALLTKIRSGGPLETAQLAAQLGTTPAMVRVMLEHLQRSGHIQPYQACGDGCGGCDLKGACKPPTQGETLRLWRG